MTYIPRASCAPPVAVAPPPLVYLPQLDSVRGFAVLLVMYHHWYGPPDLPLGPIGVWIFFVISGFLITRILLAARADAPHDNGRALRRFYVRRVLRIFPLYYFVLLLGLVFSPTLRGDWPWYVTYLQNFMMVADTTDRDVFGAHLWTLAVEEQFYVVWPLIVLFAPRAWLLPAIAAGVVTAAATRVICTARGWTAFQVYAFTPSNLDTLALGALLAVVVTCRPDRVVFSRRVALIGGALTMIVPLLLRRPAVGAALMPVPTGLFAVWVIAHIANGIRGVLGRMFSFPPSIYLGRISYGLYVYHYFVPGAMAPLFHRCHIAERGVWFGLICLATTVAVSTVSWFVLERPINALKRRFAMPSSGTMMRRGTAGDVA
jgi:peptidoglycan/LPS O-acetylase OafA/YrhL